MIWSPGDEHRGGDQRETLVLNAENDAVVRMIEGSNRRTPALLRAYYVLGRMLAGAPVTGTDAEALTESLHTLAAAQG